MSQIICLAATPWSDFTGRSRQLMSRMRNHRILYFDPPPVSGSRSDVKTATYKDEGQQVAKWITCHATPPLNPELPSPLRAIANRRMTAYIKKRMSEVSFAKPVLWLGSPRYAFLVKDIPHELVVFDCPLVPGPHGMDDIEGCARLSDVVLCRSRELLERLKPCCERVFMLQDGVDFEHFNTAAKDELPFPDALFNVKNPILGLVGRIDGSLELGFIERAARERPDWSFVFIGRKDENADLSQVEGLKNVHFIGYVEQKLLPSYLRRFDVCLHLGKSGSGHYSQNPGILYEYMSAGKPIVGTPHSGQLLEYADVAYIAGTPEEFIEQCKKAIGEREAWKVRQRITYGSAASWEARVLELERMIRVKGEDV